MSRFTSAVLPAFLLALVVSADAQRLGLRPLIAFVFAGLAAATWAAHFESLSQPGAAGRPRRLAMIAIAAGLGALHAPRRRPEVLPDLENVVVRVEGRIAGVSTGGAGPGRLAIEDVVLRSIDDRRPEDAVTVDRCWIGIDAPGTVATPWSPGTAFRALAALRIESGRVQLRARTISPLPESAPEALLAGVRRRWMANLAAGGDPDAAALMAALVLGRRDDDPHRRRLFRDAGAAHFFAVSGLHLAFLAWFLTRASRALRLRPLAASFVELGMLGLYAVIVGCGAPVLRALCGLAIARIASMRLRPVDPWCLVAAAILPALLIDPELCGHAGFRLSHQAVIGILAFARAPGSRRETRTELEAFLRRKGSGGVLSRLAAGARISLAAGLATAPITIETFGTATPAAIPAALLLMPAMVVLLILGFAALPFPGAVGLAGLPTTYALGMADLLGGLPGARLVIGAAADPRLLMLLDLCLLVAAILAWRGRGAAPCGLAFALPIVAMILLALPGDSSSESASDRGRNDRGGSAADPLPRDLVDSTIDLDGKPLLLWDGCLGVSREEGLEIIVAGRDAARRLQSRPPAAVFSLRLTGEAASEDVAEALLGALRPRSLRIDAQGLDAAEFAMLAARHGVALFGRVPSREGPGRRPSLGTRR